MTTAHHLGETAHMSPLGRRARRLGLGDPATLIGLAVKRGCSHYAAAGRPPPDFDDKAITNEELVSLLLLGETAFEPMAIRCAAQLISKTNPVRLGQVASRERTGRILSYIADAGERYDRENAGFWQTLRSNLGTQKPIKPGVLPHWSRFVSDPGMVRGERKAPVWLKAK
jgi:hypothetical protein